MTDCGPTDTIDNGTITLNSLGTTTYLSTASVSCDEGFDASTSSITCQSDGSWQNTSCNIKSKYTCAFIPSKTRKRNLHFVHCFTLYKDINTIQSLAINIYICNSSIYT